MIGNPPFPAVTAGSASRAESAVVTQPPSIFSVDVEDWFHILGLTSSPKMDAWSRLPSRVERNFCLLLDIFSHKNVQVTCFFLGWIAKRYPHLVQEAVKRGHEIASHGYSHRLVYEMSREQFADDVSHARKLLEDTAGTPVCGYRCPGFSVDERTPWFFEELARAGYQYDSSVFPATREHGGMRGAPAIPHTVKQSTGRIIEFPITVAEVGLRPFCFFGGGYLRVFPYWLIRTMARRVLKAGLPVVFYVHPREVDPTQPRLSMSMRRRFKSYVNLAKTETKIRRILDDFPVTTFQQFRTGCGARWKLDEAS